MATPSSLSDMVIYFRDQLGLRPFMVLKLKESIEKILCLPIAAFSSLAFVRDVPVQGLILHDSQDPIVSPAHAHELHSHWVGSRLAIGRWGGGRKDQRA